jgi:hypothetical protein
LAAELRSDWSTLVGARIQLRRHGKYIRSGVIDAAMPDSSVLWLAADGADARQMFEAELGYQAWIYPRELDGRPPLHDGKSRTAAENDTAVVNPLGSLHLPLQRQIAGRR